MKSDENRQLAKQLEDMEIKFMDLEIVELVNHKKKLSDFDAVVTQLSVCLNTFYNYLRITKHRIDIEI